MPKVKAIDLLGEEDAQEVDAGFSSCPRHDAEIASLRHQNEVLKKQLEDALVLIDTLKVQAQAPHATANDADEPFDENLSYRLTKDFAAVVGPGQTLRKSAGFVSTDPAVTRDLHKHGASMSRA